MSTALIEAQTQSSRRRSSGGKPIAPGRRSSSRSSTCGACTRFAAASAGFDGAYIVGPGGSEIELTIDAASIDTGIATRDEHLRSPDFFFVALHPQMRFRSTRVTRLGTETCT